MSMLKKITVVAALAAAVAPASATEQEYRDQVRKQLRQAAAVAENADFDSIGHKIEILKQHGRMEVKVRLRANAEYAIAGVCDNDCTAIGMKLIDENGNIVDEANGGDALSVRVVPAWTGPFRVILDMTGCRAKECHAGIAAFKK